MKLYKELAEWEALLEEAGFDAAFERVHHSTEPGTYYAIVGRQRM